MSKNLTMSSENELKALEKELHYRRIHPAYCCYHHAGELRGDTETVPEDSTRKVVMYIKEGDKKKALYAYPIPGHLYFHPDALPGENVDMLLPVAHSHQCAPGYVYGSLTVNSEGTQIPVGLLSEGWFVDAITAGSHAGLVLLLYRRATVSDRGAWFAKHERIHCLAGDQRFTIRIDANTFHDGFMSVKWLSREESAAVTDAIDYPQDRHTNSWYLGDRKASAFLRVPASHFKGQVPE
jgi:hypothetical protein